MFKIDNVVILAAGRGSRMLDLCNSIPKPLLTINNKPIIENIIEVFIKKNIKKIIIVSGYLNQKLEYLRNKYKEVEIVFNKNWHNTNNISSIKCIKNYLSNSLIINSDVIIKNSNLISNNYETSCTYAEINSNINEWAVITDENNNVLDFIKNKKDWNGLYQREITVINKKISNYIRQNINNYNDNEYYEYLILDISKKYNIEFKPYIIDKNNIFDIDNKEDYLIFIKNKL